MFDFNKNQTPLFRDKNNNLMGHNILKCWSPVVPRYPYRYEWCRRCHTSPCIDV